MKEMLLSESAVIKCLLERVKNYVPEKADEVLYTLLGHEWGRETVDLLNNEKCEQFLNCIEDCVDEEASGLSSLLSEVTLNNSERRSVRYYEPSNWINAVYNPSLTTKPSIDELSEYWGQISTEWISFINNASDNHVVRISQFIHWSDTWLSSVPVNKKNNSIQLSVHLRLIIALGNIYNESQEFKIVLADISGIQNYLFDVAHIGAGKVAKRLRARSFILGLLAEAASHQILRDNKLPMTNLLLSAGGLFYAILPSDVSTDEWKEQMNRYLFKRFRGSISLHSAAQIVSFSDLKFNFPEVLSQLYENIQASKGNSFRNLLIPDEVWDEEIFVHQIDNSAEYCDSCRKFPKVTNEFCEFCKLDEDIGKMLPKTKYIVFKEGRGDIQLNHEISVDLYENIKDIKSDTYYFVQVWNNSEIENINSPFQRKWIANYIPISNRDCTYSNNSELPDLRKGEPLTFSHIANSGNGKNLIGFLKADVDHLGMIFTVGLMNSQDEGQPHSLTEVLTLSNMLERFFSGGINEWLKDKFPLTYTVFSGGDDLFLVGPWDEIIRVSREIRGKFQAFVGGNPDVTLSAGIKILKPKFPIPHAAKYAEEELENSKELINRVRFQNGEKVGRNQVSIQGEILEWKDLKFVMLTSLKLSNWWKGEKLPSSFIYQLSLFSEMYKKYKDEGENQYLKFIPLLEYQVKRNLIENRYLNNNYNQDQEILSWVDNLKEIDLTDSCDYLTESQPDLLWRYMRLIIKLSSYYKDEQGEKSYDKVRS